MSIMPSEPRVVPSGVPHGSLAERFGQVRALTLKLIEPLTAEDCAVQSMPDASPAKWHLAHTSWFFEQFVLLPHVPGYRAFDAHYGYLFNSYYESAGPRHRRADRGLLTRPRLEEVLRYRQQVDEAITELLMRGTGRDLAFVVELGLNHEQQHQELLLMDIKHLLSCNPLKPAYIYKESAQAAAGNPCSATPMRFDSQPAGIYEIGHAGEDFCFDNEMPRHRVYLESFELANRLVTNGEYLDFIRDGGYKRPELWLSDGWTAAQQSAWDRPLYWAESLDAEFTLAGMRELDPEAPVCHISYYEADAFARWAGARLPIEAEWEAAARMQPIAGNFLESGRLHPQRAQGSQMFGDVWEWTASPYSAYPGFRPLGSGLGEYNGKFMINQLVLRGGCCVTPQLHVRLTYRNFFYPHMRWAFGGIRLAREAQA